MLATIVYVDVKPEYTEAFIEISKYNSENSRKEAGNIRFDVLRSNNDPNRFFLYEVFADKEAAAFHKTTEHYQKWRDAVAPMMAAPRSSDPTTPICFD